ncbi:MAG: hypothetical protein H7X77_01645 [Anaerolineae bacterium]|nr:hypothetical protein [Anaerolineae bacterium]
MMSASWVADLTIEEFVQLIRATVQEVLDERETHLPVTDQMMILDIPLLYLDPQDPALTILSRAELYDDDER